MDRAPKFDAAFYRYGREVGGVKKLSCCNGSSLIDPRKNNAAKKRTRRIHMLGTYKPFRIIVGHVKPPFCRAKCLFHDTRTTAHLAQIEE
jgi:hypothetical protein